jgi:hypothetical protein
MLLPDLLVSADFWTLQPDLLAEQLTADMGLPAVRDNWIQEYQGYGYRAIFARVNLVRQDAPTAVELIGPRPVPLAARGRYPVSPSFAYAEIQKQRPIQTHSTVVAYDDLDELEDLLRTMGVRFRLEPPSDRLPFPRYWVGVTNESPLDYRPDCDAGLFLEFVPTAALHFPAEAAADRAVPNKGRMTRILHRQWLVDDLEQTLDLLTRSLTWEASAIVDEGDYRYAELPVNNSRSATIRLVQPTAADSSQMLDLKRWGAGPYYTRVGVDDLDVQRELLARRGVRHEVIDHGRADGPVLQVSCGAIPGTLFEFITDEDA